MYFTTAGFWQYHCDQLERGVGLAEARAFIAYGGERHLSGVEAARWHERLDYEAGLRYPIPLDVQLPEPCPKAARVVIGEMRKFVGLRDSRFPAGEPFPFADEFARAYLPMVEQWLHEATTLRTRREHRDSVQAMWALLDVLPRFLTDEKAAA